MSRKIELIGLTVIAVLILGSCSGNDNPTSTGQTINVSSLLVINHSCTDLSKIPSQWITTAKRSFKLTYGHTSHGSQLVTGMDALLDSFPALAYFNDASYYYSGSGSPAADTVLSLWDYTPGGDLGNPDLAAWYYQTDTLLSNRNGQFSVYPHHRNVVMWSWCGQLSGMSEAEVDSYLVRMSRLEALHAGVIFVYMTGHLDGSGAAGNLNLRNEQIRGYCRSNRKVLYDFADIESYDPDTLVNYMELNCSDACDYDSAGTTVNWAASWVARNPGHELARLASACGGCVHSERLNCILKARAFWWMMARLAGWDGQ